MKNKILSIIFSCIIISTLTWCNNNENLDGSSNQNNENTKGNCVATECIKKINPENTVEEINNIIGFEGELTDEKYNKYYWNLSETSGIEVTYYSSDKGTISVDIDRDLLANNQVNFARYDELKEKINDGISYNEFITYIGNVEGTLIEKGRTANKYVWVDTDGSYLNASFSNSSGNCTYATGMIK